MVVAGSQVPNISVYSLDTNFQRIISSWEKGNSSVFKISRGPNDKVNNLSQIVKVRVDMSNKAK